MKIFLPMSGNLGDTCNILPVLSGFCKKFDDKIDLVVRDKMKNFKGFKELMESQPFIKSLKYESGRSDHDMVIYLSDQYEKTPNRPYETSRYEYFIKNNLGLDFEVDDDFELVVPSHDACLHDKYIVGDRTYSKCADTRRRFDVLRDSCFFPEEKCHFLDYSNSIVYNLNLVRNSSRVFLTTFTGIAILADLMKKETLVLYPEDLKYWNSKDITESFKQHFYGNRNCELLSLKEWK